MPRLGDILGLAGTPTRGVVTKRVLLFTRGPLCSLSKSGEINAS